MRSVPIGPVLAAFLFATATPLLAQQGTAEIGGKATDEQGGALPGVAIVITNEETGVFREVTAGPDGGYFASQLIPGRYRITAKLSSFRTFERGGRAGGRRDPDDQRGDGTGLAREP
jgi:hypothetical protein